MTAAAILGEVLYAGRPADSALHETLRARRAAGAKDRARIAELVYGVLRHYFPLRFLLGESATPLELCAAFAARAGEPLPSLLEIDAANLATRLAREGAPPPGATRNLPEALWQALRAEYGETEAAALAAALNEPATVDLRVNTLKATREAVRMQLAQEGYETSPTPRSPVGLRLARRAPLQSLTAFRDGLIEPQDEGSQLLAQFVAPLPGERVADFCAGAGGKTLALGALMENRGELHAFDVAPARLARMQPRLRRSGLSIVTPQVLRADGAAHGSLTARFDTVLADAPCSGTGTLRRNPELRLRAPDLAQMAREQLRILGNAARLVRPGGSLVYATCSVLREENEQVAREFLQRNAEFSLRDEMKLLPHRDGTDGFYAARLVRVK